MASFGHFAADSGRLSHDNIGTNDMGMEQD